jgi:hypothetical protein
MRTDRGLNHAYAGRLPRLLDAALGLARAPVACSTCAGLPVRALTWTGLPLPVRPAESSPAARLLFTLHRGGRAPQLSFPPRLYVQRSRETVNVAWPICASAGASFWTRSWLRAWSHYRLRWYCKLAPPARIPDSPELYVQPSSKSHTSAAVRSSSQADIRREAVGPMDAVRTLDRVWRVVGDSATTFVGDTPAHDASHQHARGAHPDCADSLLRRQRPPQRQ